MRRPIPRTMPLSLAALGVCSGFASLARAVEHGVNVRMSLEAGVLSHPVELQFSDERTGAAVRAHVHRRDSSTVLGGRLEGAYLFLLRPNVALGPRLSISYAPIFGASYATVSGLDVYRVNTDLTYSVFAIGTEVQLLHRMLVLAPEAGLATVSENGTFAGAGLTGTFSSFHQWPVIRMAIGGRLPVFGILGAGFMAAGEVLVPMQLFAPAATRGSLLCFLDLDFTRFP